MDERLMEQVMDKVLQRLNAGGPAALLIGDRPPDLLGYRIAAGAPYDAVIIGSLTAGELLPRAGGRGGTCGFLVGFLLMMALDVALG